MKVYQFKDFIKLFPYRNQSFDIHEKYWNTESQVNVINDIFKGCDVITLSRNDLFNSNEDVKSFIVKTLMWGYPTKGRGKNIDNILKKENFEYLVDVLKDYRNNEISMEQQNNDIKNVQGLGLSTITKFTQFLNTRINSYRAIMLDNQIIQSIETKRFEDLEHLQGINYNNAHNYYLKYIETIGQMSGNMNVEPDQIEIFLYTLGKNLSE